MAGIYGTIVDITPSALNSLASSNTAGAQTAVVDFSSGVNRDALVQLVISFPNTAPGASKTVFIFAAGGIESGVLAYPFSGSAGALTLPDVTTLPNNGRWHSNLYYTTQDATTQSGPFSLRALFGGCIPPYWALGIINASNATIDSSGNTLKYLPVLV